MEDLEFQLWMHTHSKKLDKKYYSRGMPVYILHKRALASAFSVVDNLRRIDFQELALTSYFMIKEAGLNELAHYYEMMLALAKTDPDKFVSRIYDFYFRMVAQNDLVNVTALLRPVGDTEMSASPADA